MQIYAFCRMTDHVHLLLALDEPGGIGKLMKLAGRQTREHNRLEGRSGTLTMGGTVYAAGQPTDRSSIMCPSLNEEG